MIPVLLIPIPYVTFHFNKYCGKSGGNFNINKEIARIFEVNSGLADRERRREVSACGKKRQAIHLAFPFPCPCGKNEARLKQSFSDWENADQIIKSDRAASGLSRGQKTSLLTLAPYLLQ
ncbi:MAG: hypothetical protein LBD68_10770 [Zoogloeaceae bacterium]|jgi:hypothetical protein|nr:hypothetical protein [Zoogloeaceae bacterium]